MKYIITETQYRFLKEEDIKLRRRINQIEELIDDEINDVMSTSGGIEFLDRVEFVHVIIDGVVDTFLDTNESEEFDEDELKEFIDGRFGDYIMSHYPHDDEDEDEYDDDDEEEDDEY
jgi:hypothetical protein